MLSCRHVVTCRHVGKGTSQSPFQVPRGRISLTLARIVHRQQEHSACDMDRAADRCAVAGTPVAPRSRPRADAKTQACIPGTRATPSTIALIAILSAQMMVVLDFSIVNVALPSIQRDLAFSASGLEW